MTEIIYTLIVTHITIVCVTLYLHRGQAHRGIIFNPVFEHFIRFWLWLTTGMNTKQWVAVHRKHHAFTETENDPHSPATYGILQVLFGGAFLYHNAVKDERMVQQFGVGTPDDTMEKFYSKYTLWGVMLMLWIDLFLFGIVGFIIWGVQMIWIPFWAAGVVNGISHWKGYRNGTTKDNSRNICPIGIIIGGEELHNNHHLDPANPKLSLRWFEFDIGYFWLRIFIILGLARLRDK